MLQSLFMSDIYVLQLSEKSVKRINTFAGNKTIGDVHLGDWGLQMGLIIEELRDRKPELPYFDDSFTGEVSRGSAIYNL